MFVYFVLVYLDFSVVFNSYLFYHSCPSFQSWTFAWILNSPLVSPASEGKFMLVEKSKNNIFTAF